MLKWLIGLLIIISPSAHALELQGFVTKTCERHVGMVIHVADGVVETMELDGQFHSFPIADIDTVYVFNIIENPFKSFNIDARALSRLKAIYLEDSKNPRSLAFPTRFIEDLVIFYSIDGKTHVHRVDDIFKLRPAAESTLGEHTPKSFQNPGFEFSDQSAKCAQAPVTNKPGQIKPTRVLADKISISEFLGSFEQGYDALDSFQERTYLYAKPFVFEQKTRLGIVFIDKREELGLNFPIFFQWSSGEAYRFQSFNVVGTKIQEFTPLTEPVMAIRSDVKSHAFHALFIGNVAGLSAGSSVFLGSDFLGFQKMTTPSTVQPSFNYMALMGADYGPYSISGGFYYPTFGIKVGDELREVRGSETSYALRTMFTKPHYRLRAIGSLTEYQSGRGTKEDLLAQTGENGGQETVETYKFAALFLRGGIDYEFTEELSASADLIYLGGNYKETKLYLGTAGAQPSDMKFTKITTQLQVRQSFSDYVSLTGYANLIQNNYDTNFLNKGDNREQRETRFFGMLEFIF